MLVEKRLQAGIRDGTITVMFRRWRARQVTAGGIYRTAAGRIAVDEVRVVDPAKITKKDARAAGFSAPDEARADLRGDPADPVYLLRIRLVDTPDPRDELARSDRLTPSDVDEITARLARLDAASGEGPWTAATLAIIAERPEVRAPDLAATLGRDTAPFKLDVRKLKNLGLTLSFPVGYRLSPRGAAYLAAVRSSPPHTAPR